MPLHTAVIRWLFILLKLRYINDALDVARARHRVRARGGGCVLAGSGSGCAARGAF
jgi:hypothetical protein